MKNILVIDKKVTGREICLHLSSYQTYHSDSSQKALEIAKVIKPDLILLNPFMTDTDGFFLLDKLQQNPQLQYIPVILLTSDDSPDFQARGLKSGVVDFILMRSDCSPDQFLDWEMLKFRVDLHLQLGEYRLSMENSVSELENNIGISFAELIECKDYNFSGHVMRTERYAELLANALYNAGTFPDSLNIDLIQDFTKAVPFHDIGKIGISDEILRKQGTLNDEELTHARSHTTIGSQILYDISERIPERPYFYTASIIALGHHERFDGSGYPNGLCGEDIPLICRIVSVVNVYDACVNERIYHPAMSHEDACKEIEKGSGSEFDPKIVEVFLKNSDKFARLAEELKTMTNMLGKLNFSDSPEENPAMIQRHSAHA
ncbi:MAG: HD domain-containing protein [Treponema sp.]|jgi:putative two-component system response regulator|nr:HD domain-containing protein [Treponema sp.]